MADLSRQKITEFAEGKVQVPFCCSLPRYRKKLTSQTMPQYQYSRTLALVISGLKKSKVKTISLYMQHRSPIIPARTTPILEVMEPIRVPDDDLSLHNL